MSGKKVSIYIENHGNGMGIQEFIPLIGNIFGKKSVNVMTSNALDPDAINIVIDEFTSSYSNQKIKEFRADNPNAKLVLMATEFIEGNKPSSFNLFSWLDAFVVLGLISQIVKIKRNDLMTIRPWDYLLGLLLFPLTLGALAGLIIKERLFRPRAVSNHLRALAYMYTRYLGFVRHLPYFDQVMAAHPVIERQVQKRFKGINTIGTPYPIFDTKKFKHLKESDRKIRFEVTGSITRYRRRWIHKINKEIIDRGLQRHMALCHCSSFNDLDDPSWLSIHPPQTKSWPYSSPTRIYRAIQNDGTIPVLTKSFGQHAIEDVCFVYSKGETPLFMLKKFENVNAFYDELITRVKGYNQHAIEVNRLIERSLIDER